MTDDARRFWSGVLTGAGILIGGLCGLCTLVVAGAGITSAFGDDESSAYGPVIAMAAVMIGAVPILIGVGLFYWGRSVGRGRPEAGPPGV